MFQPQEDELRNILSLLRESRNPAPGTGAAVQERLENFNRNPNFNCYLTVILTQLVSEPEELRCVAGLLLKTNITNHFATLAEPLKYLQHTLISHLHDKSRMIRNTIANCIATITRVGNLQCWFEREMNLPQMLCQLMDSGDVAAVDGSLSTLVKICEDVCYQLEMEMYGQPVSYLVPKLIQFCSHAEAVVRRNALGSLVLILQLAVTLSPDTCTPSVIRANMKAYLEIVFQLANDPDTGVKKDVCRCFVALMDMYEFIKGVIQDIIRFMLAQSQSQDESLALEACEFWSVIAECEYAVGDLRPFVMDLLGVLLNGMVYSDMDISLAEGDDDDTNVPDREAMINPRAIGKAAMARVQGSGAGGGGEGDEESAMDDDDTVSDWNLRKCSASGLDLLSANYGDELLSVLLPMIQERMQAAKWEVRESAILALGAIAEGCYTGMRSHLSTLVPYLIQVLNTDEKQLVRSITCWTLSRYAKWVVTQEDGQKYFEPLLQGLLMRVLDNSKKVQEAACSALATFEEEAQSDLAGYLDPIVQCLVQAFGKYQKKNLFILYDAIVTLADAVGRQLNQPHLIQALMPPLMAKWSSLPDDDRALFPLLACLTSLAQATGPGFMPYAQGIFERCVRVIKITLEMMAAAQHNPNMEPPDHEFMVCSLDMLSGLADGLESTIEPLVASSGLLNLLGECMKLPAADVRQSSFAFVGDLAKTCMPHLSTALHAYMPILVHNLDPQPVSVCNNATWAIGEIAVKVGAEMEGWVAPIIERLIPIMNRKLNRNLLENTGITLGRLGLVCPAKVAPQLREFIQPWCYNLRNIRNDIEKEHAFQGLCLMIRAEPNGVFHAFAYVCDAIASWGHPKKELKDEFTAILHGFRQHIGEQWPAYLNQFPGPLKNHLIEEYGLG